MTARNFSEDGAVGANSNGDFGSGGGNFGQAAGGFTANDSGMFAGSGMTTAAPSASDSGFSGGAAHGYNPDGIRAGASGLAGIDPTGRIPGLNSVPNAVGGYPTINNVAGLAFADGGAIPDGDEDDDPNATDPQGSAMGQSLQNSIDAAMNTVKEALSYGRQLHGLGSGGQQQAGNIPSVPFSESQRDRPMPGPLPPTANPFGKRTGLGPRADASDSNDNDSNDNDSDDAPAIATEEDA